MNNFATVFFQNTSNGWRVTYIGEHTTYYPWVDGLARRSTLYKDELAITGYVPAGLREGQFCKRPHKVIKVKEFHK